MPALTLADLLASIPEGLRDDLLGSFQNIERNFRENRWEPSELNAGKLCEAVYSIIKGHIDGHYPIRASKPANMVDACRQLEQAGNHIPRSIRIQIPRMLIALYEIRNNRGVGHVGGDINPNHMDALCVLQMSKWILSELIRVFHGISIREAQAAVDALSERELPMIWEINGKQRVLDTNLTMKEKTLVLLYSSPDGLSELSLVEYLEHSNRSAYRRDVLRKAHKARLLEYDEVNQVAHISPLGSRFVEEKILT